MEAALLNIILGVVANGLTSLLAYIGALIGRGFTNEELKKELELRKTALESIIEEAVKTVNTELDWKNPRVKEFLSSPELESLVRQIFTTQAIGDEKEKDLNSIHNEFKKIFALYLNLPQNKLVNSEQVLFKVLMRSCEQALSVAIDKGLLSAHEAKSALRHHILLDEISNIKKNLEFLSSRNKPNLTDYFDFENQYRNQTMARHSNILVPDFDRFQKISINSLYVEPKFSIKISQSSSTTLTFKEFCRRAYRGVLLGDPGSGKSTFSSKLCYDLTTHYMDRLLAGRRVTPIHVTLRDYGVAKKNNDYSLLKFIENNAESTYQLHAPPQGCFEYLLLNGRAIVIFDGLDELLDTRFRQVISADIESFANLYPSVPILITSRKVGYEQAPLDPNKFDTFFLEPFDELQATTYVHKWFGLDVSLSKKQQEDKAEAFMNESRIVSDLRSNALLLALMCNIFRGEGYIPKNRPDVYEKCATMLFERWDKSRGIKYDLPFEYNIRPTMMYLANWIYGNEKREGGVTESDLLAPATDYLQSRQFEDRDEAEHAARSFIEFCRGRAWVFTDTGITSSGEHLYQFTHRTFLEYFAAAYLVRTSRSPRELFDVLLPKIIKSEWDVVAQLAFQLQNKSLEEAGDELLSMLIDFRDIDQGGWNATLFAARCLEFMVPSPKIKKLIAFTCVDKLIDWGKKHFDIPIDEENNKKYGRPLFGEILIALYHASNENFEMVTSSLIIRLIEYLSGEETEVYLASETGITLPVWIQRNRNVDIECLDFWLDQSTKFVNENLERIYSLAPKYLTLCTGLWWHNKLGISKMVEFHGNLSMFRPSKHITLRGMFVPPVTYLVKILPYALLPDNYIRFNHPHFKNKKKNITDVGKILINTQPPWVPANDFPHLEFGKVLEKIDGAAYQSFEELLHLGSNGLFGIYALVATYVEMLKEIDQAELERVLEPFRHPNDIAFYDLFSSVILARFEDVEQQDLELSIRKCGFTNLQTEFLMAWKNHMLNLVEELPQNDNTRFNLNPAPALPKSEMDGFVDK